MNLFYTPDIMSENYTLSEEESKHCIRVMRMKDGDIIHLVDGKGSFLKAEITDANSKKCSIKIVEKKSEPKRNFHLHIAIAPTKSIERFEWFLEKAAEIGIEEITPIECSRSERTTVKTERLEKILVSAMKQSLKAHLPKLNEMKKFKELMKVNFQGGKFIAHCMESKKNHLKNLYTKSQNVLILIGPEGDFSEEEIKSAREKGFAEISLGNSRLRTETAGIVSCTIINEANNG